MKYFSSIIQQKKIVLAFCFSLSFLLHLPFLNMPPRSIHVWRQCNTLAVARNFYLEDMNILRPRVDRRLDSDGVTGMQFPSYEYLVACFYHLFGEHDWVHRVTALLISFTGVFGMYLLTLFLFKSPVAAAISAFSYTWSPELFYFGIAALPDILALASSVWGLYYFLKWFKSDDYLSFFLALFFTTLAGLTKIQFLAIGFPIAVFVLRSKELNKTKIILLAVFAFISVGITLSWYYYASQLILSSGLEDFGLVFRPSNDIFIAINTIGKNLLRNFPELLLGYSTTVLVAIGIYFFIKNKTHKNVLFLPFLGWFCGLLIYYFIELEQMIYHTYYLIPFLILLFLIAGYGGLKLYETKFRWVVLTLLTLQPILAALRIIPPRYLGSTGVPIELYNEKQVNQLISNIPEKQLCIVGPDISGCIYFYFLKQKGFGFENSDSLFRIKKGEIIIENFIRRGAKYLISNDSTLHNNQKLKPYINNEMNREGEFYIMELKSN